MVVVVVVVVQLTTIEDVRHIVQHSLLQQICTCSYALVPPFLKADFYLHIMYFSD